MQPAVIPTGIAAQTVRRVTRRLMPFLFFLYVVNYLDRINIGFAGLQMTRELHFSDAVFGFGSGIFFVGYMILGVPGGVLVERWSARKAMAASMLVWGAIAALSGLIRTQGEFYTVRLALGLAEAMFLPGILTYLGHWYRPSDRAKAVAMFMAAIPVAQVSAAPLAAMLLGIHWLGLSGWRWLLILEGAPALVCGVVSWFFLTDRPYQARWLAPEQRQWLSTEIDRGYHKSETPGSHISTWRALRSADVLLMCLAYIGGTTGSYGLNLWLPKILQKLGHLSLVETALLSAIPALVAVPAMLFLGASSDRSGERRWHSVLPRVLGAIAMAGVVLAGSNVAVALVLLSIATAGILGAYGPIWAMPNAFLSREAQAASNGLITSLGNIGGFVGPLLVGYLSTRTGSYTPGLLSVAVIVSGGSLLLLAVGRKKHPAEISRLLMLAAVLIPVAAQVGCAPSANSPGAPLFAYVGTYSSPQGPEGSVGHGQGIYLFQVDRSNGNLTQRELTRNDSNPSCLVVDRSKTHLYSANETADYEGASSGSVSAYSIDRATRHLTLLNTVRSQGAGPAHLSIHPSGRWVLVANYFGGTVAVLPIQSDGSLGPASDVKQDRGDVGPTHAATAPPGSFAISGHDGAHAHMILADPSGKFVLVTDLGLDRIFVWKFDVETGTLSPNDPASAALPSGDGPRHFAFHPNGRWLYSLQEESSTLVRFDWNAGNLTTRQTISSLPPGFKGTNFTSEIMVSSNGKYLYAADRLHDSIAQFSIGPSGDLSYLTEEWTRGDYPRTFEVDPSGRFLYSCNQRSDAVTIFRVDPGTGRLTFTGQYVAVGTPSSIVFVE